MADDAPLLAALAVIQARGAIGEGALGDAVAHADRFVALIPSVARNLVDLGSGGGLPALVIAWRLPDLAVTMVERRSTRADLLRRAVAALEFDDRVAVAATDVAAVCRDHPHSFDVVTARSFADPVVTAGFIDGLLDDRGIGLVSEPPDDRTAVWAHALADLMELVDGGVEQGIRRLVRRPAAR
jgi:16S rRNA (guanine527-N7)-methyltransferase